MSFVSILFPDTGDFLEVADPKTEAGQAAWERATAAAVEFSRNPGEAAGGMLLALVGVRSSLGDPRKPGFIEGLSPSQRIVAMEQLAPVAATAHHLAGRNADGTRNPTVQGIVTMTAQGEAIISRPVTKAAAAAALRLAADQAGAARGELLVKAAVAEREAADLAKAAAQAEAAWLARAQRRIDAGIARARARRAALAKAAAAGDDLPVPDMLYKAGGTG
jgi:hypothetical protein